MTSTEQDPAELLDQEQTFDPASSYDVRDEIDELIRRDLLGPWGGEAEQLPSGTGPRERYLVGMLGPRRDPHSTTRNADELPDTELGVEADASEADLPEVLTPQDLGRIWASSMGLAFAVDLTVDALVVEASWARYERRKAEGSDGKSRRKWVREPFSRTVPIQLDGAEAYRVPLTADSPGQPGVQLAVTVRSHAARRVVEVTLVNAQLEPPAGDKEPAWLFQTRLVVTPSAEPGDERAVFLPVDDPADDQADAGEQRTPAPDPEDEHLRLLYRRHCRYGNGRNVAIEEHVRPGESHAFRLETTWLPSYDVPPTEAPSGAGSPLAGVELSMDTLAEASPERLGAGLSPMVTAYEAWIDQREAEVPGLSERLRAPARAAVTSARTAAGRIRAGIALLADPDHPRHGEALAAFRFANQAMARQRRHSTVARLRQQEGLDYATALARVEDQGAKVASWRPFQLAFVLLNLPALTEPAHAERGPDPDAVVDLLFFPTGGGKTEAYLGLTAYTLAIRRLQGVVGEGDDARDGSAGTAVLMRYTLRLLTAQQFQRASALICAAELLRRDDEATWGTEPFRIGLWVGGGVSPNWYTEAAEQIGEARTSGDARHTNVLQVLFCPWCGESLRAQRNLHPVDETRRVLLFCPNGEGKNACPFSQRRSEEGLPILTVDEEIYRYAPSLIIATVDKLAQLPWRGYAGHLFGRVTQRCPRHGYRHVDLDKKSGCGVRHNRKGNLPAVTSQQVDALRPPDLIIQDELHLISGALGTTVGAFEAAVDELCTWTATGPDGADRSTGPKIVASTATTKRARAQVRGVFARDLAVFPPQVLDVSDTFFSRQLEVGPDTPGRRYLGVCAHGVRLKAAEIRVAEILLLAGQTAFDRHGERADPYMTLVGYFNAIRELAGMRRYLDDDVATRIRHDGRRLRGISDRAIGATGMLNVQELTSRVSSGDISEVLSRLEIEFDQELDTSQRRRAITRDRIEAQKSSGRSRRRTHPLTDRYSERQKQNGQPADVVLATSMLQVGVDVQRFGLMMVTGQPKNTAEYIQATSRVGREAARPGLVVTLYNWSRPRDLAHYEDFRHYHATFYQQVEALSVTPYTRRALDRTTAGTFVTAVRYADPAFGRNEDAGEVPLDGPTVAEVVERLLRRAEAVDGTRGRRHLEERLAMVTDEWNRRKDLPARLAYEKANNPTAQVQGLLDRAGARRWGTLTVGMSMRETESELNLLVPAGDQLFAATYNAPAWDFGPADGKGETEGRDGGTDETKGQP